jgi:hypothetical protein
MSHGFDGSIALDDLIGPGGSRQHSHCIFTFDSRILNVEVQHHIRETVIQTQGNYCTQRLPRSQIPRPADRYPYPIEFVNMKNSTVGKSVQ